MDGHQRLAVSFLPVSCSWHATYNVAKIAVRFMVIHPVGEMVFSVRAYGVVVLLSLGILSPERNARYSCRNIPSSIYITDDELVLSFAFLLFGVMCAGWAGFALLWSLSLDLWHGMAWCGIAFLEFELPGFIFFCFDFLLWFEREYMYRWEQGDGQRMSFWLDPPPQNSRYV